MTVWALLASDKESEDCMRYLRIIWLVVVLLMWVQVAGRADEVFTVKCRAGSDITIPVPEGYKQLSSELLKKYAQDSSVLAILVPVEDYAEYLAGMKPKNIGVISIKEINYNELLQDSFAEIKEFFGSKETAEDLKQSYQRIINGIEVVNKEETTVEVKTLRDTAVSYTQLLVARLKYVSGSTISDLTFTNVVDMGEIVFSINYDSISKAEAEVCEFNNKYVDSFIALNPQITAGRNLSHQDAVAVGAVEREQSKVTRSPGMRQEESGGREFAGRTKEFNSADFANKLPFAFSFRYPSNWAPFEFDDGVLSSHIAREFLTEFLRIDTHVLSKLQRIMANADEATKKAVVASVAESSNEIKDFPGCSTITEKIGRFYTGINTYDYCQKVDNREVYFKARRFHVVASGGILTFTLMLVDFDTPEYRRDVEARLEELSMEVKEIIKTLSIGAEAVDQQGGSSAKDAGAANTARRSFSRLNKWQHSADYPEILATPLSIKFPGDMEVKPADGYLRLVKPGMDYPLVIISYRSAEFEFSEEDELLSEEQQTKVHSLLLLGALREKAGEDNYQGSLAELAGYTLVIEDHEKIVNIIGSQQRFYIRSYWVIKGEKQLELALNVVGLDTPEGKAEAKKYFEEYDVLLRAMITTLRFE